MVGLALTGAGLAVLNLMVLSAFFGFALALWRIIPAGKEKRK